MYIHIIVIGTGRPLGHRDLRGCVHHEQDAGGLGVLGLQPDRVGHQHWLRLASTVGTFGKSHLREGHWRWDYCCFR